MKKENEPDFVMLAQQEEHHEDKKKEAWSYIKGDVDDLIFYGEQVIGQSER